MDVIAACFGTKSSFPGNKLIQNYWEERLDCGWYVHKWDANLYKWSVYIKG